LPFPGRSPEFEDRDRHLIQLFEKGFDAAAPLDFSVVLQVNQANSYVNSAGCILGSIMQYLPWTSLQLMAWSFLATWHHAFEFGSNFEMKIHGSDCST